MVLKVYPEADEAQLFDMMQDEGDEWECYFGETVIEKYKKSFISFF